MLNRLSTDSIHWIVLIGIALLFIELIFFNSGLVFSLLLFSFLIYIGRGKYEKVYGKILFWIGMISIFFSVINMIAVRFLAIAAVILLFVHYYRSKNEPEVIKPTFQERPGQSHEEPLIKRKPLFKNTFFGNLETSERPYEWQDINIHGGVGDRIIDLSNTVLPDEPIISIRHLAGNITMYIPYEVEAQIHHSTVFGKANLFEHRHRTLFNQTIIYETENYKTNTPRVKIITSLFSGDIEVKRI